MGVTFLLQSKYQKNQLGPPVNKVTLFRLGAHTALPSLNLQCTLLALNGRLPQSDRLDRRICHRRMTLTLGMASTWQICWSRTSWQLTWRVCVRCLGIAQWAMYYWWNNSAVLRRLNNLDPVELVKTIPMSVFMLRQCRIEVFRHVNYWEPICIY